MKNFIEERKKDIAKTIAENPTKIIINRTNKVPKGGGRSIEKSVLGPFLIRIFNQKSKAFQVIVSVSFVPSNCLSKALLIFFANLSTST